MLSRYESKRSTEVAFLFAGLTAYRPRLPLYLRTITSLRLPKIRFKLTGSEHPVCIGTHCFIDGYHQGPAELQDFEPAAISRILRSWRHSALGGNGVNHQKHLTHLRLTDFFHEAYTKKAFVDATLGRVNGATVITDDEELVRDAISDKGLGDRIELISSAHLSALETLRVMASFASIETNGSSLAMWASVLAQSIFISSNKNHMAYHDFAHRFD